MIGIGGAPTRATTLPSDPAERKKHPVASGVLDYFPDALAAIANVSWQGNEQHNPGQPLHWARGKSADEADTMMRHFLERGTLDKDGVRHSAKMAWRALALLQKEIEAEAGESYGSIAEAVAAARETIEAMSGTYDPPAHGFEANVELVRELIRDGRKPLPLAFSTEAGSHNVLPAQTEAQVDSVRDDHDHDHESFTPAQKKGAAYRGTTSSLRS